MSIKFRVCVCARARVHACARRGGSRSRERCSVVSSSAQSPPYMDIESNSIDISSVFSKAANIRSVPIRRAAERDGSAFGTSRHPEVMVFLRPSRTIPSVRPRPRPSTCLQFTAALYSVAISVVKCTTVFGHAVCPSVGVEQLSSHWTDCHEILYLSIFRKIRPANSSSIKI